MSIFVRTIRISDPFIIQIAETIKKHRKINGLSQHELANFAGVGKTVVFDLEHGKSSIQLDTLLKILEALNVHLKIVSPTTPMGEEHAQSESL